MGNLTVLPGQVNQTQQAPTTQDRLGQMVGRVTQWNPDAPSTEIRKWINDAYRSIIDLRRWTGLKIRGQVTVPNVYSTGTIAVTLGSTSVVGTGTAFDATMVGRQLRAGFSTGFYNIAAVADATHLTLDLPWGNASQASSGFTIMQTWISLGYNIKSIKTMVNQRQGYRMIIGIPQKTLNLWDTWRASLGWTWGVSPKEPTATGEPQWELYPAPTFQQVFPYIAYIQPADMVNDEDFPVPFIPTDMLILPAIANALVFRGPKANKYYDPNEAERKLKQFNARLQTMWNADDSLDQKDLQFSDLPMVSPGGSNWRQNHDEGGW